MFVCFAILKVMSSEKYTNSNNYCHNQLDVPKYTIEYYIHIAAFILSYELVQGWEIGGTN